MSTKLGAKTLESMSQAQWYNQWTLKKFEQYLKGDILEVGCGIGNFTQELTRFGNVYAIDIDSEHIKDTDKLLNGKGRVGFGDIEAGKYFFMDQKFDSIVCINVLEHIKNDSKTISNIYSLLKPGGSLVLLVPAHQFLYGEIDKGIGHLRRYNKKSLVSLLKNKNLKIERTRVLNILGAIGWFISAKFFSEKFVDERKLKVFNLIAPWVLPLEDLLEPPIGTSILVIAKK